MSWNNARRRATTCGGRAAALGLAALTAACGYTPPLKDQVTAYESYGKWDANNFAAMTGRVVPLSDLRGAAMELARRIAAQPPLAVAFAKQTMNAGMQVGIDAGLVYERYAASILVNSEDRKEGFRAFVEKRPPVFKGV